MHFALLTPDGQQMIGACNFSGIIRGAFQACYLGYHIDQSHQGQGLMQEGLEAGIGYMFETQNLHRIMANYIPGNERSARLLERLGFEREGYAKAYLNIAGRWQDHVLTALVNPVFEARKSVGHDNWREFHNLLSIGEVCSRLLPFPVA
jgi:ribosomal-protein-alanine N-acetyltransferase